MSEQHRDGTEVVGHLTRVIEYQQVVMAALAGALREQIKENKVLQHSTRELQRKLRRDFLLPSMLNKIETERLIFESVEKKRHFGMFLIDLDNFKKVNDTFGHSQGDAVLKSFARALDEIFKRKSDRLGQFSRRGRVGGDEFVVLIDLSPQGGGRTQDPVEQMDNVYRLLRGIEERLHMEYPEAAALGLGLSVGGAWHDPQYPVDAMTLVAQADEAMYEEKGKEAR